MLVQPAQASDGGIRVTVTDGDGSTERVEEG